MNNVNAVLIKFVQDIIYMNSSKIFPSSLNHPIKRTIGRLDN